MFKHYLSFLLGFLLPLGSYADTRDPTQPVHPPVVNAPTPAEAPVVEEAPPVLSAIWIAPNSRRATLNGVTAKEGQTILNNVQVIKISHNQVVIKHNNSVKTLQLLQHSTQKP